MTSLYQLTSYVPRSLYIHRRLFVCLLAGLRKKLLNQFLPRDAMRKRGLCCRPVTVRLSVTLVHSIQTAEDIVKLLSRPGSHITLVIVPQRR